MPVCAASTLNVLVDKDTPVPATKAVLDIAIAALALTSALTITPLAIPKTPALVKLTSPLGTTGLKFVPSATMIAVFVFVPMVISSPETVKSPVTVKLRPTVASLFASSNINLLAGIVQNTSFVPAAKSTALSLLEEDMTVVLAKSELSPSSVPNPTSNSFAV